MRLRVEPGICKVEGCERDRQYLDGLCNMHRSRMQRTGSTEYFGGRKAIPNYTSSPILTNIEVLTAQRGWSLARLCRSAGLDRNQIYRMQYADPRLDVLRSLGAAFNVEYWRLLIPGEFTHER